MARNDPYEEELPEEEIEQELKGREEVCSCKEDPKWCPIHNNWG